MGASGRPTAARRSGTSARTSARRASGYEVVFVTPRGLAEADRREQVETLERLGSRAVVAATTRSAGVDLADAHEHVADEAVVPGHVDEVDLAPSSSGEPWA